MHKTIALVGAKGGTAKSSTVSALGHLFARAGLQVALADIDAQGTLTRRSGLDRVPDPLRAAAITVSPEAGCSMRLLPGGRALEAASEPDLTRHLARAAGLGELLIVDTPPAIGPAVRAALRAADLVLVPCTAGAEALDGLVDIAAAAHAARPDARVRAMIVLERRPGSWVLDWTVGAASQISGVKLLKHVLWHDRYAARSGTYRLPVTAHAPRSGAAAVYRALARDLAHELGIRVATSAGSLP